MDNVYNEPIDELAAKIAKLSSRILLETADELDEESGLDEYVDSMPLAIGYLFGKVIEELASDPAFANLSEDIDRIAIAMHDAL